MDYKLISMILVENAAYRIKLERICMERGTWRNDACVTLMEEATNLIEDGSKFDTEALFRIRVVIDVALCMPHSQLIVETRGYLADLLREIRKMTANYNRKSDRDVSLVPTMRDLTAEFSKQIKQLTGA